MRNMSITTGLILSNVVVFLLGGIASVPAIYGIEYHGSPNEESVLFVRGAYSWFSCFIEGEIWRLFTYQFLHAGTLHLFFNMWGLYYFGPAVEDVMGPRRFLAFYLACGVAGALFSSLMGACHFIELPAGPIYEYALHHLEEYTGYAGLEYWQVVPMVGASAAIYGVLVAVAFLYPHLRIRLIFPPVAMSLRTFALLILGIAVFTVMMDGSNSGGEAGHLGGIILSAIIMLIWRYRYLRKRNHDRTF